MQTSIDVALHVVTHPQYFAGHPQVMANNWEHLKQARGQTVNRDRIGAPAYLIAPASLDEASAQIVSMRIRTKVRDYAEAQGYDLPPSAA